MLQFLYKLSQLSNEPKRDNINKYSKKLTLLDKIYKDKNKSSSIGDNFNFKVTSFYDKCKQVRLLPNVYIYSISIILSGQTQTFYYANCWNVFIFNQFYYNMQLFFESFK